MADGPNYENVPTPGGPVPDAPEEGKDDADEKKELENKKSGSKMSEAPGDKSKMGGASEKSGKGGKKKKKKGKKEKKDKKKKKTAHFKKRGHPAFKILCMVFSVLALLSLIGCVICGIMIAVESTGTQEEDEK